MQDGRFPVVVSGVPVVTAPEEIDITNAPELGPALLEAAANGARRRSTAPAGSTKKRAE